MPAHIKRFVLVLILAGLVALELLGFSTLASAYYLEAGGRALESRHQLADNPLLAVDYLQQALEWDARNTQAYRLLARAYQAQGDLPAAVEELTRFTELRPDNPLGHIELAQLYEDAAAEMAAMRLFDLVASLSEATVDAPDVLLDTPFSELEEPSWRSYVAPTTFKLLPDLGQRPTLFMHPPARVTYTLSLPAQPTVLHFAMGLDPRSHDWPGDGATFEVFLNGERVFLEHVDKAMARRGWHEREMSLSPWTGEEVRLTLTVTPGPVSDHSGDWAGWGEPRVVDAKLATLEAIQPQVRAIEEWQRAEVPDLDFLAEGHKAFERQHYGEASTWYKRGAAQDSEIELSVLFRWAISAIMSGESFASSTEATALPVHVLVENAQIEAETLRWILASPVWNVQYGARLIDYPAGDPTAGVLWWQAPAVAFVEVQREATYHVTVRAKHSISGPGRLQVGHNLSPVASFSLTSDWQEFETRVDLHSGLHIIDLAYTDLTKGVDGDAIVDWIRFERHFNNDQ